MLDSRRSRRKKITTITTTTTTITTTFSEDDGGMSSCADLKHLCEDDDTRDRVRRICPVTCGLCPGLVADRSDVAALLGTLSNRTVALELALDREGQPGSRRLVVDAESWRISRILHQTWKTDELPAKYE
ncbi:unnamed protein product, partial [Polarella glacialis]